MLRVDRIVAELARRRYRLDDGVGEIWVEFEIGVVRETTATLSTEEMGLSSLEGDAQP